MHSVVHDSAMVYTQGVDSHVLRTCRTGENSGSVRIPTFSMNIDNEMTTLLHIDEPNAWARSQMETHKDYSVENVSRTMTRIHDSTVAKTKQSHTKEPACVHAPVVRVKIFNSRHHLKGICADARGNKIGEIAEHQPSKQIQQRRQTPIHRLHEKDPGDCHACCHITSAFPDSSVRQGI